MRVCGLAMLCAALAGCSSLGSDLPVRAVSQPPSAAAIERSLTEVARNAKWVGMLEASPVRQAHALAPADWIVCVQSGSRDLSPSMALFFTGDKMIHVRTAIALDDCARAPYAPVMALVPAPPAPTAAAGAPPAPGTPGSAEATTPVLLPNMPPQGFSTRR